MSPKMLHFFDIQSVERRFHPSKAFYYDGKYYALIICQYLVSFMQHNTKKIIQLKS